MNKIEQYLNLCARHYYAGDPIISDEVFDQLSSLNNYNEVGARQHENVKRHAFQMYSLQKFYEGEDKQNPLKDYKDIDSSPKLDGAAISLLYVGEELVQVLTRGDGIEGQDVTDKFLATNLVPHELTTSLDDGWVPEVWQITGEIVAPKLIENARNYAAGALNLKDINEFKTRGISFVAHGVYPYKWPKFTQDMWFLRQLGFSTIKDPDLHNIFDCDGIVNRVNCNKTFQELGYTAKHPRGAYALKERGASVETVLLDVEWNVGKTGKVTPVAILEPVKVGDALVSRATLNNIAFIRALDLYIGDTVGVIRSGEVIPCVTHKVV